MRRSSHGFAKIAGVEMHQLNNNNNNNNALDVIYTVEEPR